MILGRMGWNMIAVIMQCNIGRTVIGSGRLLRGDSYSGLVTHKHNSNHVITWTFNKTFPHFTIMKELDLYIQSL